jgi:hypothetical protein
MASREPGDPRGDLYQEELKLLVPVKPPAQLRDRTVMALWPTVLQLRLTCQGLTDSLRHRIVFPECDRK